MPSSRSIPPRALACLALVAAAIGASPSASAQMYVAPAAPVSVSTAWLAANLKDPNLVLLHVGDRKEYDAGHIPGAVSIPVAELERRLRELPKRREVIAYCRGPYCVFSLEAVTTLRKRGYRARRSEEGLPAWRDAGFPVATRA